MGCYNLLKSVTCNIYPLYFLLFLNCIYLFSKFFLAKLIGVSCVTPFTFLNPPLHITNRIHHTFFRFIFKPETTLKANRPPYSLFRWCLSVVWLVREPRLFWFILITWYAMYGMAWVHAFVTMKTLTFWNHQFGGIPRFTPFFFQLYP